MQCCCQCSTQLKSKDYFFHVCSMSFLINKYTGGEMNNYFNMIHLGNVLIFASMGSNLTFSVRPVIRNGRMVPYSGVPNKRGAGINGGLRQFF